MSRLRAARNRRPRAVHEAERRRTGITLVAIVLATIIAMIAAIAFVTGAEPIRTYAIVVLGVVFIGAGFLTLFTNSRWREPTQLNSTDGGASAAGHSLIAAGSGESGSGDSGGEGGGD